MSTFAEVVGMAVPVWRELATASPLADGRALAKHYADRFNAMADAGQPPGEAELHAAGEELAGTEWCVSCDPRTGRWQVDHADRHKGKPEASGRKMLSTEHAPKGGVVINGQFYRGGQFIPRGGMGGTPEASAAAAKASRVTRQKQLLSQKTEGLHERLGKYAGEQLAPHEQRSAVASYRQLQRHHGPLVKNRVAELAGGLEKALARAPEGEEGLKSQLRKRLKALHTMVAQEPKQEKKNAAQDAEQGRQDDHGVQEGDAAQRLRQGAGRAVEEAGHRHRPQPAAEARPQEVKTNIAAAIRSLGRLTRREHERIATALRADMAKPSGGELTQWRAVAGILAARQAKKG